MIQAADIAVICSNISVPAIVEEPDYESGTDDPDSRTNLDQVKVLLSFDSALRSPSMCNVIPDNSQGQEQLVLHDMKFFCVLCHRSLRLRYEYMSQHTLVLYNTPLFSCSDNMTIMCSYMHRIIIYKLTAIYDNI